MRLHVLLVAPALVGACGGALTEGESQFKKGRYPEAKQTLASLERDSRSWDDATRAEYALYRGLTFEALGDRAQAGVWLREAKAIEDVRPGSLSREDGQRLKVGLDTADE
ncbi:MAG TPA: hypothetical protein VKU41_00505 [Polyangiaceae bacterium]|nr:hypothetical protein [Polyangiaceae bacterium]